MFSVAPQYRGYRYGYSVLKRSSAGLNGSSTYGSTEEIVTIKAIPVAIPCPGPPPLAWAGFAA